MKLTGLSFWVGNEKEKSQNRCQAIVWFAQRRVIIKNRKDVDSLTEKMKYP